MTSLNQSVAAVNDKLLPNLSFELPKGASFVTARTLCTFYPVGAASIQPDGVRLLRFTLATDGWLDVSTLRLSFYRRNKTNFPDYPAAPNTIPNSGAALGTINLLGPPGILWNRIRVLSGGAVVRTG